MKRTRRSIVTVVLLTAIMLTAWSVSAQSVPGSIPEGPQSSPPIEIQSISPVVTEFGFISASVDGTGTIGTSSVLEMVKPAGATVRNAYLATASTCCSNTTLSDGDVTLNGTGVNWDVTEPASINAINHWADVTSIVKPILDAAPTGLVEIEVGEPADNSAEGHILAVIYDDPNQSVSNTVVLLFGAQDIDGDTFSIGLAEPIDTSAPGLGIQMGLGISFGFQSGSSQYSQVDINGQRLTTSAGGEDDGESADGALITVGGTGDSPANPEDPNATGGSDPRQDDELYDLLPFVNNGDTSIDAFTVNPSNDDNIFFAYLLLGNVTAIVGEGIVLGPATSNQCMFDNADKTVTANVQDGDGDPVVDVEVTFEIVSGPHAPLMGTAMTNANGQASFTYTGSIQGTDTIVATFENSEGNTVRSNQATVNWQCSPTDVNLAVFDGSGPAQNSMLLVVGLLVAALAGGILVRRRSEI